MSRNYCNFRGAQRSEEDWWARNAASLAKVNAATDQRAKEARKLYQERKKKNYEVEERNLKRHEPKTEGAMYSCYQASSGSSSTSTAPKVDSRNPESQTRTLLQKVSFVALILGLNTVLKKFCF